MGSHIQLAKPGIQPPLSFSLIGITGGDKEQEAELSASIPNSSKTISRVSVLGVPIPLTSFSLLFSSAGRLSSKPVVFKESLGS